MAYFNHRVHVIPAAQASTWQRREFLHAWWSIYAEDRRWTPPVYATLARELQPRLNPHVARLRPIVAYVDALYRTGMQTARQDQPVPLANILERPLAAAVALVDPRRNDKTGYLALLQTANDSEAIERLLDALGDTLRPTGIRRLLGPTGLSPYFGTGLQVDDWDLWPPIGAPSNPPYVPDLLHDLVRPFQTGTLYQATVPDETTTAPGPAVLQPLDPQRLSADLLSLLAAVIDDPTAGFAPPDEAEAAFLLRMAGAAGLGGWLAEQDGHPVGFVLLGPDTTRTLRRARGGKRLHRRAWLAAETRLGSAKAGRILFGGVLPEKRRQGIGRHLWSAALASARAAGWQSVSVGPVWAADGQAFLAGQGAVPVQTVQLVDWTF